MGKIQKSYRLPAETVDAVHERAELDGTSDAEAMAAIVSEWDTYRKTVRDTVGIHAEARKREPSGELEAVWGALEDSRATVADLRARLDAATEQNASLLRLAERSQALQAVEAAQRPGLARKVRSLLSGWKDGRG